jgi:hypothetical protein
MDRKQFDQKKQDLAEQKSTKRKAKVPLTHLGCDLSFSPLMAKLAEIEDEVRNKFVNMSGYCDLSTLRAFWACGVGHSNESPSRTTPVSRGPSCILARGTSRPSGREGRQTGEEFHWKTQEFRYR